MWSVVDGLGQKINCLLEKPASTAFPPLKQAFLPTYGSPVPAACHKKPGKEVPPSTPGAGQVTAFRSSFFFPGAVPLLKPDYGVLKEISLLYTVPCLLVA